jgi:hypothetical protein
MNEIDFRHWLSKSDRSKKVQQDIVSRLKTLRRAFNNCDLDVEYKKDKCESLFKALENKGINDEMKKYGDVRLPIGKYTLSVYRYALRLYVKFLES